jgi:hypothetical protein
MPASRGSQTPAGFPLEIAGAALEDAATSAPLTSAYTQFNDMTTTKYAHHFTTQPPDLFFYDCVGFTGYTVRKATPTAWHSLVAAIGLSNGFVPKPITFARFLNALATHPQPGWLAVPSVSDIRGGDIIAWQPANDDGSADTSKVGHAVIPLMTPRLVDGSSTRWEVVVMDSTATQHGPHDTRRPENPLSQRNIPVVNARGATAPSGLGIGTMGFRTSPQGHIVGVEWSLGRAAKSVVLGAGRSTH